MSVSSTVFVFRWESEVTYLYIGYMPRGKRQKLDGKKRKVRHIKTRTGRAYITDFPLGKNV